MPDIKHAVQIAASPEKIYPLAATAHGFTQWWAEDVVEKAGLVELGFFNRATVYRLRRTSENPPQRVEWICESGDEWGGTRIVFELEAPGANTQLRFAHAGWRSESEYFRNCNTTWGELMYLIKAAAEDKSRGPLFLAGALAY